MYLQVCFSIWQHLNELIYHFCKCELCGCFYKQTQSSICWSLYHSLNPKDLCSVNSCVHAALSVNLVYFCGIVWKKRSLPQALQTSSNQWCQFCKYKVADDVQTCNNRRPCSISTHLSSESNNHLSSFWSQEFLLLTKRKLKAIKIKKFCLDSCCSVF